MNEVSESTVRARQRGQRARRNTHPDSSKLKKSEEKTLLQYIRKLKARGFAPTLTYVEEMANQLLGARVGGCVGENWVTNFIRRKAELKSQLTRQAIAREACAAAQGSLGPDLILYRMSRQSTAYWAKIHTTSMRLSSQWASQTE